LHDYGCKKPCRRAKRYGVELVVLMKRATKVSCPKRIVSE